MIETNLLKETEPIIYSVSDMSPYRSTSLTYGTVRRKAGGQLVITNRQGDDLIVDIDAAYNLIEAIKQTLEQ